MGRATSLDSLVDDGKPGLSPTSGFIPRRIDKGLQRSLCENTALKACPFSSNGVEANTCSAVLEECAFLIIFVARRPVPQRGGICPVVARGRVPVSYRRDSGVQPGISSSPQGPVCRRANRRSFSDTAINGQLRISSPPSPVRMRHSVAKPADLYRCILNLGRRRAVLAATRPFLFIVSFTRGAGRTGYDRGGKGVNKRRICLVCRPF